MQHLKILLPLLTSVALIGCDDKEPTDTGDATFLDKDNDGYSGDDGDCADDDPLTNPASVELCDGIDNNCNDFIDEDGAFDAARFFLDFDGDGYGVPDSPSTPSVLSCAQPQGYVDNQIDCDDSESRSFPGNDESCDNVDNDCDGTTDEGTAVDATTWYADSDSDGYGSPYDSRTACDQPSGYVVVNNKEEYDCNDQRFDINPGATERCDTNGDDEDCDGLIDDQDDPVIGKTTFYFDGDGDGWGVAKLFVESCVSQPLFVESEGDCNDGDRFINPDYNEICGNGIDDDCNKLIDDGTDYIIWYRDADGDNFGSSSSPGPLQCSQPTGYANNDDDCNDSNINIYPGALETWYNGTDQDCAGDSDYDADGDGYDSEAYGGDDCDDSLSTSNPGLPEVCDDNTDNNCDSISDTCEQDAAIYGEADDSRLGSSVSFAGDWDGDGQLDVLVGASRYDVSTASTDNAKGAVYVVSGPVSGPADVSTLYDLKVYGANSQDYLGAAVAELGAYDGDDSYSDIAMGAYGYDGPTGGAIESGAVYIINGPLLGDYDVDNVYDAMFYGESAYDWAGFFITSAGDVDDDGYGDLLIGAYRHDSATITDSGAAYLILGPTSTTSPTNLSFADTKFFGTSAGQWAGYSLGGGGDIDGDGDDDMIIGSPQLSAGSVYSYVGGAYIVDYDGSASSSLASATGRLVGVTTSSYTGYSVAVAGDVNSDGYDDVIVGAPEEATAGPASGAAYIVHGPISGTIYLYNADAIIEAEDSDDYLGASVAAAGDVDNDGRADVVVGATKDDYNASNAGAAYIIPSPILGTVGVASVGNKLVGVATDDNAGTDVAGGADIDDDGYDDVLVGAPYNDDNADNGGAAYLVLGGGF